MKRAKRMFFPRNPLGVRLYLPVPGKCGYRKEGHEVMP